MPSKITSIRPWQESDEGIGMTVTYVDGPNDGLTFNQVEVQYDDGTKKWAWQCDGKPGLFKQVFVPLNSEHPLIT